MFKKLLITYFSLCLALSPVVNATTLTTNKTINLAGSNLNADNKLDLNANNVVLTTTQQVGDFYSGNSKNYLKENSTTNLKSQIKATDINISANEQVIIKGANCNTPKKPNTSKVENSIIKTRSFHNEKIKIHRHTNRQYS